MRVLFSLLMLMLNGASPWFPKHRSLEILPAVLPSAVDTQVSHHAGRTISWLRSFHPRRHSRLCFAALLCASLFCLLWFVCIAVAPAAVLRNTLGLEPPQTDSKSAVETPSQVLPPLYEDWYEFERNLPQQDPSLPYPEGADADFFYASNHVWGLGFNNALQEQLFLSHLAYIANRTYVFDVYTWNPVPEEPYTNYYGKLIPSRIPFTAFISGPTVGGSFGEGDHAPRAVSKSYFREMCPEPTLIRSNEVNDNLDSRANAMVMMEAWAERLKATPSKCVEIGDSDQIFNFMVFGDEQRLLPFFDEFLNSPILRRFSWSSLVNDAVSANLHLFTEAPRGLRGPLSPIQLLSPDDEPEAAATIPGLLAIHVRRGDFEEHCKNLARWGSNFMGWLQHPLIVDRFEKPQMAGIEQSEAITNYYMQKCWPSIEQMVKKIDNIRWMPQGYGLKRVYIMTNGPSDWVAELKAEIMKTGGWDSVVSSDDLVLIPEQQYIAQAVDMAIAMRSQVFIGNGFSSLSANVILLRLSRHFNALANRLW